MHILRLLAVMLATTCCLSNIAAQKFEWDIDFNTVFDNREGDSKMVDTRTFLHTQLAPEVGVSMFDDKHALMGGVVWTQPIGDGWRGYHLEPTLYYRYNTRAKGWGVAMGMFPRTLMVRNLPNYVWSDSVYYTQRNIRGFMVQYNGRDGFFEATLDWRQRQTRTQREAFNILAQGEWNRPGRIFLAGGVAVMNHLALVKDAPEDQHIVDNFLVNPYVGVDLTQHVPMDSLALRVGALSSIIRNRYDKNWHSPTGFWADLNLQWRWLGWHNTFYAGGHLFPYYSIFGPELDQGEPYYRSDWYNRTTVYGDIISNKYICLRASLDFNLAQSNFTFYQRLTLRVYLPSNYRSLPASHRLRPSIPY